MGKMIEKRDADSVVAAVSAYADSRDARIAELEAALRLIRSICASKYEPHHNVAAIDHHAAVALGQRE